MDKEHYRKSLNRLASGACWKFESGDYVSIGQAARDYSNEVGPIFNTTILMLYDYAMNFFDGDEDDLLDYLRAYQNENESEIEYLLGEG